MVRVVVGMLCLLSLCSFGTSPDIKLVPKSVRQGQVALLRVKANALPAELRAKAADQEILFWPCKKDVQTEQCGLVAVPLDTPVGKISVSVSWAAQAGTQTKSLSLGVRKGKFLVNRLKVDPSLTQPSEEEQKQIAIDKKDIEEAYLQREKDPLWEGAFELPTKGGVTSFFGNQRTYNGEVKSTHFGVDLRAGTETPIHAINQGKVLLARLFFFAGNMVLLDHGRGVYSSYAHLSNIAVKPGQIVKKGEVLGMAGATGRVTGPHLHWGTRANGVPVDPHSLLVAMNRGGKGTPENPGKTSASAR